MSGERKSVSIGTMQKGSYIIIDGAACKVTDVKYSKPGKHGHAKINLMAVGILDGKKRNLVMPGHDHVEVPIISKRNAQVLSVTANQANVMDSETYETFDLKIPDELKDKVTEGINILYWQILEDKVMKDIRGGE